VVACCVCAESRFGKVCLLRGEGARRSDLRRGRDRVHFHDAFWNIAIAPRFTNAICLIWDILLESIAHCSLGRFAVVLLHITPNARSNVS
jgi:hypothetical protein